MSNREEPGATDILGTNSEKPVKVLKVCSSKMVTGLIVQLKCLYTNAHSFGNRQKLEASVHLENYDLITITETWWDTNHIECTQDYGTQQDVSQGPKGIG